MLLEDEERYIQKIPEDKIVMIKPFDLHLREVAENIIKQIDEVGPDLEVVHMGASGLGISGQGDLDIYALADPKDFSKYLPALIKLFGEPKSQQEDSVGWEFDRENVPVEFYLTDPNSKPMKRQIAIFNLLKEQPVLLEEYEELKSNMNGKSFRDYQREKYGFYHRILGD